MRKMTVSKLRKLIDEVYKNNPRAVVAIDHDSFRASPDFSIHDVVSAELLHINLADGDGVCMQNKDGSERLVQCLVLGGGYEEPRDEQP